MLTVSLTVKYHFSTPRLCEPGLKKGHLVLQMQGARADNLEGNVHSLKQAK